MIVGILFIVLIMAIVWSIFYGRKLIKTEKTDFVFGNPSKALGGWHWVIAGVSSILVVWIYFSWDAGRAYFPNAGNELCQVAKLTRSTNPIRSSFPLDKRLLNGTKLLQRDYIQINLLEERLATTEFNDADRAELSAIIKQMRDTLAAQTNPDFVDSSVATRFGDIASRINSLADNIISDGYPGAADEVAHAKAMAQPGWGQTSVEIPPLPVTERGRKFDVASKEMGQISKDFADIRNNGHQITQKLASLESRYNKFSIDTTGDNAVVEKRKALVRQIGKIYNRIDNGRIFPEAMTRVVEYALIKLDNNQKEAQAVCV